jgi:hypothetical protein
LTVSEGINQHEATTSTAVALRNMWDNIDIGKLLFISTAVIT